MTRKLAFFLAALVAINTSRAGAQAASPQAKDSLFLTIAARDSSFFDAYNKCELAKMKSYFTTDLEFYHDQSGLSRLPGVMSDLRKYVCGKVHRDPVPGTLEVNPLKGYGAVATGLHRFCDSRKVQDLRGGNEWRREIRDSVAAKEGSMVYVASDQLRSRLPT
jgi:hypothetical protein